MPPTNPVYDAAQRVLQVVIDGLEDLDDYTFPDPRVVAAGERAVDCEMLVLQVPRLFNGFPDNEKNFVKLEVPRVVPMTITMWRCVPTLSDDGEPPEEDLEEAASAQHFMDGWHMLDIVYKAYRDKSLFEGVACELASIGAVTFGTPSGAFSSSSLALEVQVHAEVGGS